MATRLAPVTSIFLLLAACSPSASPAPDRCPAPTVLCGDVCVDLQASADHCGECGNACTGPETCLAGVCACEAPYTTCDGACVSLATDAANCGACGTPCAFPAACTGSACVCSAPYANCDGACVSLLSDARNCGACGRACAAGDACFSGVCGPAACTAGAPARCGAECVDLQTDPLHCGSCTNGCAALLHCVAGSCTSACPPFQSDCGTTCANLRTDAAHCGACGVVCGAGTVCSDGECVRPCAGTLRFPGAASLVDPGAQHAASAVGDLDGDGQPDLVMVEYYGAIKVARGLPGGWFAPPVTYAVTGARRVAVADLDGSGRPDLAVGTSSNGVAILLDAGDGTLLGPTTFAAGTSVNDLTAADLDADGDGDVAILTTAGKVDVLWNAGNGTFGAPVEYALGAASSNATELEVGDVTADGKPDLVVGGSSSLSVFAQAAGGAFSATPVSYDTYPDSTTNLKLADLDGDGRLDAVFTGTDMSTGVVSIRWNAVTRPFSTQTDVAVAGWTVTSCTAADVDADGALDLVAADYDRKAVAVMRNTGGRTFAAPSEVAAHAGPQFVHVGLLDGDSVVDLLALSSGVAEVFPGLGGGAFEAPARIRPPSLETAWPYTPEDIHLLELGDLDGNGGLDLVIATFDQHNVDLAPGMGDGTFGAWTAHRVGNYVDDVRIADLNGDGWLDVVYVDAGDSIAGTGNGVRVLLNDAAGGFTPLPITLVDASMLAVGDVSEDGIPDVVTGMTGSFIAILLGNGDGTFQPPAGLSYWPHITDKIAVVDLDGDGRGDLVQTSFDSGSELLSIFRNKGGATVAERFTSSLLATYPTVGYPKDLAVSDVDGDGRPDVVVLDDGLGVYRNTGTSLAGRASHAVAGRALRMKDLNGDRRADAIVATSSGVLVSLQSAAGSFASPVLYPSGSAQALAVGDLDADGRGDVLTSNAYGTSSSGDDISRLGAQCGAP
jgi:hypothetical protein